MAYVVTIIAVSVDAYFASMAYGLNEKLSALKILYAASFTFFMCVICGVSGEFVATLSPLLGKTGGVIFLFLGARNYLSFFGKEQLIGERKAGGITALGVAVSVDAGISSFAANGSGMAFVLLYAFGAFVAHFIFLLLGARCVKLRNAAKNASFVSGLALMIIGIYKTVF